MASLKDQVVLITGCSSGIGRALAIRFARTGHKVFAGARRIESVEDLKGKGIDTVRLDVTEPESIRAAVEEVLQKAGRIDIAVNNAGVNCIGPLAEVPLEKFEQTFKTNVAGPVAVVQAVFPHMAERRSGRIVNVGSVVGVLPTPYAGTYCATKSALHTLSEVMRMELEPFGIDVVVVQPGAVRSNIAEAASAGLERYDEPGSRYRKVASHIRRRAGASQERPTDADDFAAVVATEATRRVAPRIVRAGNGATLLPLARKLVPDALLERAFRRAFGLNKLRS